MSFLRTIFFVGLPGAVAILAVGCGDDDLAADDGGTEDVGADADADGDTAEADGEDEAAADDGVATDDGGAGGTLDVLVVGSPVSPSRDWAPVEGAAVALDLPGGGRVEATTDATGRAAFDRLDWSAGTAAVTAGAENRGLASLVGLDGSEPEVTLVLPFLGDPREGWVELSVDAENFTHATSWFDCGLDLAPNEPSYYIHQATEATLPQTLLAPPGVPLTVAGAEWRFEELPDGFVQPLRPFCRELEPIDGPGSVVVDLATLPAPDTAVGSFRLPARADSPLRDDIFYGWVFDDVLLDPARRLQPLERGSFGAPTRSTRAADGETIEYEWAWAAREGSTLVTVFDLRDAWAREDRYSAVYLAGHPPDGPQDFTFLETPTVLVPASILVRHPLHDAIEWESYDSGVTPTLYVEGTRFGVKVVLWQVTAPTGATTLSVPEPPGAIDATSVLGTGLARGRIGLVADDPGALVAKYSQSRRFTVDL
ncbi:MAG: hypothetical protein JXB32_15230 [Deltaproteobacteria bacterium]|nr:hypothetical protein [Deltaproteobacteria bacterium]